MWSGASLRRTYSWSRLIGWRSRPRAASSLKTPMRASKGLARQECRRSTFASTLRHSGRGRRRLQLLQVRHDLGAGPVLRRDEFAAEHAISVDDIAFGDLESAVEAVDAGCGVSDGKE